MSRERSLLSQIETEQALFLKSLKHKHKALVVKQHQDTVYQGTQFSTKNSKIIIIIIITSKLISKGRSSHPVSTRSLWGHALFILVVQGYYENKLPLAAFRGVVWLKGRTYGALSWLTVCSEWELPWIHSLVCGLRVFIAWFNRRITEDTQNVSRNLEPRLNKKMKTTWASALISLLPDPDTMCPPIPGICHLHDKCLLPWPR